MAKAKPTAKPAAAGRKRTTATRARAKRPQVDWAPAFLAAFRDTGNVRTACEIADIGRSTVYARRDTDAAFREAWKETAEEAADLLEAEARRRALYGVAEPITGRVGRDQDGQLHDDDGNPMVIRRYSDALLMFLLKANRPEKFRERFDVHHITEESIDAEIKRLDAEIAKRGGEVPNDAR